MARGPGRGSDYFAGVVGRLRFPGVYSGLHALAKADNLGRGGMLFGLALAISVSDVIARRTDALRVNPWKNKTR